MLNKTIASNDYLARPIAIKMHKIPRQQRGVTLLELMVGLSIGLMVVAASMAALMVSRSVSGTVSDASGIQQQAAYAMRTIGGQLRQAGSLYLNPDPIGGASSDPLSAVVFETDAKSASGISFDQASTISGSDTSMTTTFRRYKDAVFVSSDLTALARNCLGGPADNSVKNDEAIKSAFTFDSIKNELQCSGNDSPQQPIVQNVAQFQLTYIEQTFDAGGTLVKYLAAADVTDWRSVQGVQICLVLYGNESISMPTGSAYTDCDGSTKVDMTNLTGARANRMHLVFTNTFQLRSQGLL